MISRPVRYDQREYLVVDVNGKALFNISTRMDWTVKKINEVGEELVEIINSIPEKDHIELAEITDDTPEKNDNKFNKIINIISGKKNKEKK